MSYDLALWVIQDGAIVRPDPHGGLIDGIHKVAQRVIMALLEEQDAPRYRIGRPIKPGCQFMSLLCSGKLRTETDVFAQFCSACGVIKQELATDTRDSDPPEERLKDLQLTHIYLGETEMLLQIVVTSVADEITLYLPIATQDIP